MLRLTAAVRSCWAVLTRQIRCSRQQRRHCADRVRNLHRKSGGGYPVTDIRAQLSMSECTFDSLHSLLRGCVHRRNRRRLPRRCKHSYSSCRSSECKSVVSCAQTTSLPLIVMVVITVINVRFGSTSMLQKQRLTGGFDVTSYRLHMRCEKSWPRRASSHPITAYVTPDMVRLVITSRRSSAEPGRTSRITLIVIVPPS